jgi:hypothetical protein
MLTYFGVRMTGAYFGGANELARRHPRDSHPKRHARDSHPFSPTLARRHPRHSHPEIRLLANYLILAIKCRRAASVEESRVCTREPHVYKSSIIADAYKSSIISDARLRAI